MAYFQGLERTAAVWEELREELAAFTISNSGVREWQEAFVACQEFQPESEAAGIHQPPLVHVPRPHRRVKEPFSTRWGWPPCRRR